MTNALRNSGVAPDEIDYIVAHGTATPLNDVTETRAIKAAYGDHAYKVAISSPKSMIGHLVGAAGIASALAGIGAIRDQVIPPTANLRTPDPECDLDYVPLTARKAKVETVAVDGFGFGGQNAVTIFRRSSTGRARRAGVRPSNASIGLDRRPRPSGVGRVRSRSRSGPSPSRSSRRGAARRPAAAPSGVLEGEARPPDARSPASRPSRVSPWKTGAR